MRTSPPQQMGLLPRTTALVALSTIALLSACQRAAEAPVPEVRPVRAVTIEKRSTTDTVALTGTVQAETEVNHSFRIDGRIIERKVNVGDVVRPGNSSPP